jgi:hypothetical protein
MNEKNRGEASGKVSDLIENDFGNIQRTRKLIEEIAASGGDKEQKQKCLKDIVFYCSRLLLVARVVEPKSEAETYHYFRKYFINTGLVDAAFDDLLKIAVSGDYSGLLDMESRVYALVDRMRFFLPDRFGIGSHSPNILFWAMAQIQYIVNGLWEVAGKNLVKRITLFIILFFMVLEGMLGLQHDLRLLGEALEGGLSRRHKNPRRIKQEQYVRRLSQETQNSQRRLLQYRQNQIRDTQRSYVINGGRESQKRFAQDRQRRIRDMQHK